MGKFWRSYGSLEDPVERVECEDADGATTVGSDSDNDETDEVELFKVIPRADAGRQANMVLLACCLLQVPVWGFAISYGVLQEFYVSVGDELRGDVSRIGIIGNLLNGIMYLSMPMLFGMFTHQWARYRKHAAIAGILLSALSLVASSFSRDVWELIITQGILQAFGSALLYSTSCIYLDEWFVVRKGFAYGMIQSMKSATGVAVPLLFSNMLIRLNFQLTLQIWAIITIVVGIPAVLMLKTKIPLSHNDLQKRGLAWGFLYHNTYWVFQFANIVFSSTYGLPQTFLAQFASNVLQLSSGDAAWIVVALNVPSVAASFWFGLLSDGGGLMKRGRSLSISSISVLSATGAAIPTFLLWGLVPGPGAAGIALLTFFALTYGFYAGGYSSTWGGVVKEMQKEAELHNEPIDTGLLFGLLNGGRGIGFVAGGFIGVELLKAGPVAGIPWNNGWAYGTEYGSLILFIAVGSALGGLIVLCRNARLLFSWKRNEKRIQI